MRFKLGLTCVLAVCAALWFLWRPESRPQGESAAASGIAVAKEIGPAIRLQRRTIIRNTSDSNAARVRVGDAESFTGSDARGKYTRISVPAATVVSARVPLFEAEPGERVSIQAEDGGNLLGEAAQGHLTVDDHHGVQFEFRTPAQDGMYRGTIRRGSESRVLEFWVGAEPPIFAHGEQATPKPSQQP